MNPSDDIIEWWNTWKDGSDYMADAGGPCATAVEAAIEAEKARRENHE